MARFPALWAVLDALVVSCGRLMHRHVARILELCAIAEETGVAIGGDNVQNAPLAALARALPFRLVAPRIHTYLEGLFERFGGLEKSGGDVGDNSIAADVKGQDEY